MRQERLAWRGAVVAVSVAAMLAATLSIADAGPAPSSASPPGSSAQGPDSLIDLSGVAPGPKVITLVTGDKVSLQDTGHGYTFSVDAAPRPDGSLPRFDGTAGPGHFYVYPSDVEAAVEAGRVDRHLFDVKYLAENGYTDAQTSTVPLIVQYPASRPAASVAVAAQALPASTATRDLPSVHGAALSVPRRQAGAFWSAVRGTSPTSGTGGAPSAVTLGSGLANVWLDARVRGTLDQSVPLIGAPTAWAAGYDGTGVRVAILDTGIDQTHPDLAGKVVDSRSFVPGVNTVADDNGHGTHVASTVAGTGAASGGRYKGVAPGAELVIGKVLNGAGSGSDSWIIAGMDWAAHSGAKIVSMSLGGDPTDGTDPLSQAVDNLTAQTGTLFAIAAGNSGPSGETVSSPGAAEAALTVAAVDKSDQLAGFSSRGPRLDSAMKPDIAAPGVQIVAARATGTTLGTPVDQHYTTLSGTSMATPHVSGSAALLAEEHPDWAAPQLKAALMSTTRDDGYSVYEQGAGRVDVARAITQKVVATTPHLDFGTVEATDPATSRQVTYTDLGDTPVTLTLTSSLRDKAGDAVSGVLRGDQTVTVPAGGTATATVTVDPTSLTEGTYSGAVVATDTATGTRVTTPVGIVREPPKVTLTIHTLDVDGNPTDGTLLSVIDVTGGRGLVRAPVQRVSTGVVKVLVPRSTYSISKVLTWIDDDSLRRSIGYLLDPQVTVDGDTDVTLDGRELQEFRFTTPEPTETSPSSGAVYFRQERTTTSGDIWAGYTDAANFIRIWVTPTAPVTQGRFEIAQDRVLAPPEVTMRMEGANPVAVHPVVYPHDETAQFGGHGVHAPPFSGQQTDELVSVGRGTDLSGLNLHGKLALMDSEVCGLPSDRAHALRDAGAVGILVYPTAGCTPISIPVFGFSSPHVTTVDLGIPYVSISPVEGGALLDRLVSGPVRITVTGDPTAAQRTIYRTHILERGRVPVPRYTLDDRNMARIDADYHSSRPTRYELVSTAYTATPELVNRSVRAPIVDGPARRTEYVGPVQPDVVFISDMKGDVPARRYTEFDRPARLHESWGTPFASVGARTIRDTRGQVWTGPTDGPMLTYAVCAVCRQGDTLYPAYHHTTGWTDDGVWLAPTLTHLYRDGQEIPFDTATLGFTLPKAADNYRMTLDDPVTNTSTEWTFRSAAPAADSTTHGYLCVGALLSGSTGACQPEPVVFVNYDFGDSLALDNTAAAGRANRFRVFAYHSPSTTAMPPVTDVRVWVSTDDGAHWAPAKVERDRDGGYTASTVYPEFGRTTGAVSLKVQARDAAGDTVTQTTTRAFALRDVHTPSGAE